MTVLGRPRHQGQHRPARRNARPHGRPVRADHRRPRPGQLPRGPLGPRVLHLHARRPQGTGRHRAATADSGLPDPAPRRRGPDVIVRDEDCGTGRGAGSPARSPARSPPNPGRSPGGSSAGTRPPRWRHPTGSWSASATARSPRSSPTGSRTPRRQRAGLERGARPLTAHVRIPQRGLPRLLRAQPRDQSHGRQGRGGRDHRRPVHRRARHAAYDANLPHRRRRRSRHHRRPAARRGAVRGPRPQGQGRDRRIDGIVEIIRGDGGTKVKVTSVEQYDAPVRLQAGAEALAATGDLVEKGQVVARISGKDGSATDVLAPEKGFLVRDGDHLAVRAEDRVEREYSIPHNAKLLVESGQEVRAGDPITDSPINPQEFLETRSSACSVPGEGSPEGLPEPGRHHQRQAHRDHRPPDAPQGANRPPATQPLPDRDSSTASTSRGRTTASSPRAASLRPRRSSCSG